MRVKGHRQGADHQKREQDFGVLEPKGADLGPWTRERSNAKFIYVIMNVKGGRGRVQRAV